MKMYGLFKHVFIATTPFHDKIYPKNFQKESMYSDKFRLDSGSSMTKAVLLEDTKIIDKK